MGLSFGTFAGRLDSCLEQPAALDQLASKKVGREVGRPGVAQLLACRSADTPPALSNRTRTRIRTVRTPLHGHLAVPTLVLVINSAEIACRSLCDAARWTSCR